MAEEGVRFKIPAVDDFCRTLRESVSESGGPEGFFESLSSDRRRTLQKNFPARIHEILKKLLNDKEYRELFLNHVHNREDYDFILTFLRAWEIWYQSDEFVAEDVDLFLTPSYEILLKQCPRISNDVISTYSITELESFSEEFMIKVIMKMSSPNKDIGGPYAFVMSGRLSYYLETVRLMLAAARVRETGLFKIPEGRDIARPLLEKLEQIQQTLNELRGQFEAMR